jgi:penicillin-binding protein 2
VNNLLNNPSAPLINRAISGVYPAGSIFKLVVATCALETGKINLSTTFSCPGSTYIGKQEFSCWNTHQQQNLIGAITHSCNIFFYRTGLLAGAQNIYEYALKFGFARPTGIDLPYEASGFVPSPLLRKIYKFRNWFDGDTANFSIGQGELLVSPLQISRMMAVFANKGTLVIPYVVKGIDGKVITSPKRKALALTLKESTINYIRQGLKNVIADPNGTASHLSTLPVPVAAKTGTAQVSRGQPHGWFVGFFPYEKPKFTICVFLEHGGSGYAATLVAKQIIENMAGEGLI